MNVQELIGRSVAGLLARVRGRRWLGSGEVGGVAGVDELVPAPRVVPVVSALPARRGDPGSSEVKARLERSGASPELVGRVLAAVEASGMRGLYAIDAAARAIAGEFRVAAAPRRGVTARSVAFVGPTGVGKTTALAKLVTRMVQARRSVAVATLETREGAVEQLEARARMLRVPFASAFDGEGLIAAAAPWRSCDLVLIDTPGRSPRDRDGIGRLGAELARARAPLNLDVCLVLSAGAGRAASAAALAGFGVLRPSSAVVTKLDETVEAAPVLEMLAARGLAVSFLCDGQDIGAHLHRAGPDAFADLLLRGRVA